MEYPCFNLLSFLDDDSNAGENNQEERRKALAEFNKANQKLATAAKTRSDVGKFNEYIRQKNVFRNIEDIAPDELDLLLSEFFRDVRKLNGDDMEPSTIKGLQRSIERYLKEAGYEEKISSSTKLSISQMTIATKMKILKASGKGNRPNRASPLTTEDEDAMWRCGALGMDDPVALTTTLWWFFTTGFGLRGRHEHMQMLWQDVTLETDSDAR